MTRSLLVLFVAAALALECFAQAPPPTSPAPGGPGQPGPQQAPGAQTAPGAPNVRNPQATPGGGQGAPANPRPPSAAAPVVPAAPGTAAGAIAAGSPAVNPDGPLVLTLGDAFTRARQYGYLIQGADITAAIAREDRVQARAATLPSVNAFNQFIYTEGNGTPSGVFVANNGVHVYNEQMQVHQEVFSVVRRGELRRAEAAEAAARARVQVAARGLNATVIANYFTLLAAQRRLRNAELSVREAEQFADITQKQELGGEVAHADVIKALLQLEQRRRDLGDAQLAIDRAKIALGVLVFSQYRDDFSVEDDLSTMAAKPIAPPGVPRLTITASPEIRAAQASLLEAGLGVDVARYAFLPSLAVDFFYGLNSNELSTRTGLLPGFNGPYQQNLGYSGQVTLNVPIWNWGTTRSKIRQAELRRQQAELDLRTAQRQLQANLDTYSREARLVQTQIDSLQRSVELATESLRLTLLRYQAGEATALEVVDAQSTVALARNALDDGVVRYRTAAANLQTLTGAP